MLRRKISRLKELANENPGWSFGVPNLVWHNWPGNDLPTRYPEEFPLYRIDSSGKSYPIPNSEMTEIQRSYVRSTSWLYTFILFVSVVWLTLLGLGFVYLWKLLF
jgi:hypothetical protein